MSEAVLSVQIDHRVGDTTIAVAAEIKNGITVLFGPSGAGKTTTLSIIAGLERPNTGKIKLGNDVWLDTATGISIPTHRRNIAFVFQSPALFPHLNARANVEYGMLASLSADEKKSRAIALLETWRVPELAERMPRTFSGGEAQRVALARAFATSPRVVLLDEPFSALDEPLRESLADDLKAHLEALAVPAIFVTHSAREARALADRVLVIEKGKIVNERSPRELRP